MEAVLAVEGGRVTVKECINSRLCSNLRGAGTMRDNEVDPLEAAYQLVKGRVTVEGLPQGWIGGIQLVNMLLGDPDLFIVYHDLRRRGRRVRRGVRGRTLIVQRGEGREMEVLVLSEGGETSFSEIAEWSRLAARDGYTPVVAVVDGYGVVTYYEARVASALS